MIRLRFGIQIDMRDSADFGVGDLGGEAVGLLSSSGSQITAATSSGGTIRLNGRFDLSSEQTVLDSLITGLVIRDNAGNLIMSIAGVAGFSVGDIDNDPTLSALLRQAGQGVVVTGSRFDDQLVGGPGNDTLNGAAGEDTVRGAGGADKLNGGSWSDKLYGGPGNDTITGGGGNDILDGGPGRDVMRGGVGNDRYFIDHAADQVTETAGNGTDEVRSRVDYTLRPHIENLRLIGGGHTDGTGTVQANTISGNGGNNTLDGRGGNDTLIGSSGRDELLGGYGNDILLGGGGQDLLYGGVGADLLNGGHAADRMFGGPGNDRYVVNDVDDFVREFVGEGIDTVLSSVTMQLRGNFENLKLMSVADIDGSGNVLPNDLVGNAGDNILSGFGGGDTIHLGLGTDTGIGGSGNDTFMFDALPGDSGAPDNITDFLSLADILYLDESIFTALDSGVVDAANFIDIADTPDGNDYLAYDGVNGLLYYDASGAGGSSILFADLGAGTVLTAGDIFVG